MLILYTYIIFANALKRNQLFGLEAFFKEIFVGARRNRFSRWLQRRF